MGEPPVLRQSEPGAPSESGLLDTLRRLETLSARLAAAPPKGADAAERVAAAACEALGASAAVLATRANDGALETLVTVGYDRARIGSEDPSPLDPELPLGKALDTGAPIFIEDREALIRRFPKTPTDRVIHEAWAALPLHAGARPRGVVVVAYARPRSFDDADRALAATVASMCASALERAVGAARLASESEARRRAQVDSERLNLTLQERVQEFQTLLDVMPTGIAIAHDAECRYITTNPWLSERLGVEAGRNISKTLPDNGLPYRVLRDGRECAADELPMQEACATGRTVREVECEIVRGDGERVILLVSAAPVFDERGDVRGCLAAFTDVTQRRSDERLLAEREARWRRILENMPVMLSAFREGTIAFWNKECERVTGYAADEVVENPHALEMLYPDREYRERMMREWENDGETYREREWDITCKDGTTRTIAWSSLSRDFPVAGWSSWDIGIDMTQRRRVERDLRISRERFELVSHATNDAIWDRDLRTGTVWWSDRFTDIFGHVPQDLEGGIENWASRIHPDERDRILRDLHAALDGTADHWKDEYRFRRAEGTYAHVVDRGRIVRDGDGRAVRMLGSMIDISERVRLEREAVLQRETLARQERLSALGTLVSGVAHEVRTPLAYINNHAHIMRMRLSRAADEPARELAARLEPATDAIVEGVERIDRLVQDLRRFLRPEPSDRSLTDLDESLQEAARMFQATHRAAVNLRMQLHSGAVLPLDKVEVQQVVLNLLENAAHASPSGGTVTLATQPADEGVRIVVQDEGSGIAEDVRLHMFDPFFTTKEEGTGLGLSIVRRIIESHGGSIECESAPGKGTRFIVTLPDLKPRA